MPSPPTGGKFSSGGVSGVKSTNDTFSTSARKENAATICHRRTYFNLDIFIIVVNRGTIYRKAAASTVVGSGNKPAAETINSVE